MGGVAAACRAERRAEGRHCRRPARFGRGAGLVRRVDRTTLPTPGPSGPFRFPAIHRRVLSNGLDVRAIAHRNVPVVTAVLLVPAGTAADPADRPGLAAFTADLLDEGSAGRSAIEVSDALARCGADFDIDVGPDAIAMALTTLTQYLKPGL